MHTTVLFHSITCINPCELLLCVIRSLICPYVIPSCPRLEKDLSSFPFGQLPSWLLPSSLFLLSPSSLPFLPLPLPLSLLFSLSSFRPLLIVSLLCSSSFPFFISLLSIIFEHPIFASILPSVLDVDSTLSTVYLIHSLLSFLPHLIESYPLSCLSVQGISSTLSLFCDSFS